MGIINIPQREREAIKGVDQMVLREAIRQCFDERRSYFPRGLGLEDCGPYVAREFRDFEKALTALSNAKSSKKRAETESDARRAGSNLENAVCQMKARLEEQEKDELTFLVEDQILPPLSFSSRLSVRVNYRWRPSVDGAWQHGSIAFLHEADLRPGFTAPQARKVSAAKQREEEQEALHREWDYLMRLGVGAVAEFLKERGNGAEIPSEFMARTDSYPRRLNNHSAKFWANKPGP